MKLLKRNAYLRSYIWWHCSSLYQDSPPVKLSQVKQTSSWPIYRVFLVVICLLKRVFSISSEWFFSKNNCVLCTEKTSLGYLFLEFDRAFNFSQFATFTLELINEFKSPKEFPIQNLFKERCNFNDVLKFVYKATVFYLLNGTSQGHTFMTASRVFWLHLSH